MVAICGAVARGRDPVYGVVGVLAVAERVEAACAAGARGFKRIYGRGGVLCKGDLKQVIFRDIIHPGIFQHGNATVAGKLVQQ